MYKAMGLPLLSKFGSQAVIGVLGPRRVFRAVGVSLGDKPTKDADTTYTNAAHDHQVRKSDEASCVAAARCRSSSTLPSPGQPKASKLRGYQENLM